MPSFNFSNQGNVKKKTILMVLLKHTHFLQRKFENSFHLLKKNCVFLLLYTVYLYVYCMLQCCLSCECVSEDYLFAQMKEILLFHISTGFKSTFFFCGNCKWKVKGKKCICAYNIVFIIELYVKLE